MVEHRESGLTFKERLAILPAPPAISSAGRGWAGVRVERQQSPTIATLEQPALSDHLLMFYFVPSAQLKRVVDGVVFQGRPEAHSFTLIPAGFSTVWDWHGKFDMLNVLLSPDLVDRVADEGGFTADSERRLLPIFDSRFEQIRTLLLCLNNELVSGERGERLVAESLTVAIVVHLLRQREQQLPRSRARSLRLGEVLEYIHAHLADDMSLMDLASIAGVTVSHFNRQFKKATGRTPHQYILAERIEQAKHLIKTENYSLAEVALLVGFSDQSHLTRNFKRFTGTTPGQFR